MARFTRDKKRLDELQSPLRRSYGVAGFIFAECNDGSVWARNAVPDTDEAWIMFEPPHAAGRPGPRDPLPEDLPTFQRPAPIPPSRPGSGRQRTR